MGTTRVTLRLPDELVERTEAAAESLHRNRSDVLSQALREYLESVEDDEAYREEAVAQYLDGCLSFESLAAVVGRRDAAAVRASKGLLDQGDELADGLADL